MPLTHPPHYSAPQYTSLYVAAASGGANPLALLIAPLAGIALLTAAAAVAINPVLVTVSVTGKRRKRRDLDTVIGGGEGISPELEEKIHEMQVKCGQVVPVVTGSDGVLSLFQVLEKFMSSVPENTNYQQQVRLASVRTVTDVPAGPGEERTAPRAPPSSRR